MNKFRSYSLAKKSDELKKLILENPDLPIVVLADENSNCEYWGCTFCSEISFRIDEILDCNYYGYNDEVFTDRERLEEKIIDDLYDEYRGKSDEEYDKAVDRKIKELEPYWKKVIAIYATN